MRLLEAEQDYAKERSAAWSVSTASADVIVEYALSQLAPGVDGEGSNA